MNNRVWTSGDRKEWRELLAVARNEFGDIVLTLDGGEVWQFTPLQKDVPTPAPERVKLIGHGLNEKGELTMIAFFILENPKQSYTGNLRIIPPPPAENGAGEPPKHAEILPGWKRGKLVLKQTPNGKTPAMFNYGKTAKREGTPYTVPSGDAWTTVCNLINADAYDTHGLELKKSPSEQFKRGHRKFFSQRMGHDGKFWFIKTT